MRQRRTSVCILALAGSIFRPQISSDSRAVSKGA